MVLRSFVPPHQHKWLVEKHIFFFSFSFHIEIYYSTYLLELYLIVFFLFINRVVFTFLATVYPFNRE